jgi:hypothetical protein
MGTAQAVRGTVRNLPSCPPVASSLAVEARGPVPATQAITSAVTAIVVPLGAMSAHQRPYVDACQDARLR